MSGTISNEAALIYVMVMMTGVEGKVKPDELAQIEALVRHLPVFERFDISRLQMIAGQCGDILQEPDGMQTVIGLVKDQLPQRLRETAYALAVEIAAADLLVGKEELRFLAILRDGLSLDKLTTAAIERSAIARYQPR